MKNKIIVFFILLTVTVNSFADPASVSIISPSGSGKTYNTRPWVQISVQCNDGVNVVNSITVGIWNTSNSHYDYWETNDAAIGKQVVGGSFRGLPIYCATPATIYYRVADALSPNITYILYVYVRSARPDARGYCGPATVAININSVSWSETIVAGTTLVKVTHFTELRNAINDVRVFRGLAIFNWTSAPTSGNPIYVSNMINLQDNLAEAYTAGVGSSISFTHPSAGDTVKKSQIDEMRNNVVLP